jgi:hypothetical protein
MVREWVMAEEFKRSDRSDLSGMDKRELSDYLKPHYATDEDLSVENVKLALGPWLVAGAVIGGLALAAWGLLTLL